MPPALLRSHPVHSLTLLSGHPLLVVVVREPGERPRVEPAVFVLDTEQSRGEPPLDGPSDRETVAPAARGAGAGRVARVVQALQKRWLNASGRERFGCFGHRGGGAILSRVAGSGRRRRITTPVEPTCLVDAHGTQNLRTRWKNSWRAWSFQPIPSRSRQTFSLRSVARSSPSPSGQSTSTSSRLSRSAISSATIRASRSRADSIRSAVLSKPASRSCRASSSTRGSATGMPARNTVRGYTEQGFAPDGRARAKRPLPASWRSGRFVGTRIARAGGALPHRCRRRRETRRRRFRGKWPCGSYRSR